MLGGENTGIPVGFHLGVYPGIPGCFRFDMGDQLYADQVDTRDAR